MTGSSPRSMKSGVKMRLARLLFADELKLVYRLGKNDGARQLSGQVRSVAHQVGVIGDILEDDCYPPFADEWRPT